MYKSKRTPPLVIIIGAVVLLTMVVFLLGRLDFPGWVFRGLSSLVPHGKRASYTAEEVENLRTAVGDLESENAYLREMITQFHGESELGSIEQRINTNLLPAKVIYRDHARLFDTALLNRGSADGVKVGMPVVESRGLVGRVVSTRAAISRIILLTSPDCSFGVIDQRSREIGIVRGSDPVKWRMEGSSKEDIEQIPPDVLELEYLSPSADISVQDTLITSGLSGITPAGIRVGEIVEIISRAEQGWFDIRVRPFANLEHLETVAVVLFSEEERTQLEELIEETGNELGNPMSDQ